MCVCGGALFKAEQEGGQYKIVALAPAIGVLMYVSPTEIVNIKIV